MTADSVEAAGLFIGRDLFFASKVTGTAAALGLKVDVVADSAAAVERLAGKSYRCVFVDLAEHGLNLSAIMDSLPVENRPRVIAFGSHVATETLNAAREAGCDEVLPRSRFSAELPRILKQTLGS